jgi:UDP-N-acetylmuramyl pentapeptide synthase
VTDGILSLAEVVEATGARVHPPIDPAGLAALRARGISIDTRTLRAGELFVALRGPRTDGHRFRELAPLSEATKALRALVPLTRKEVAASMVRGQYGVGEHNGEMVKGYRQEEGVSPKSVTETYVALRVKIDNWRWAGVPFFLRSGKRLGKRGRR